MSSRAFRKLQEARELAVAAAAAAAEEVEEEEEEEEVPSPAGGGGNLFAALLGEDDSDEEAEAEPQQQEDATAEPSPSPSPSPSPARAGKKKRKKNKKKRAAAQGAGPAAAAVGSAGADEEDIDAIIEAVNREHGDIGRRGDVPDEDEGRPASGIVKGVLSVERRHLSADLEMKRKFGNEAVRGSAATPRGHQRYMRKTLLATPRDTWPVFAKSGVSMIADPAHTATDGASWFRFVHNDVYQKVQLRFLRAVQSFNPNLIMDVLRANPYHLDSLLQMSEISRMGDDVNTAADFIERALFCFESSFAPMFNLATGTCRLDYNVFENRAFFLAVFRHANFVSGRGCWRTALEYTKLLLGLSPEADPLGAILMVDYFALRASANAYLRQLYEEWNGSRQLASLPNFAYSVAMAEYFLATDPEQDDAARPAGGGGRRGQPHRAGGASAKPGVRGSLETSQQLLQEAVLRFPQVVTLLAERCGATLHPSITGNAFFQPPSRPSRSEQSVHQLCVLFVERSHTLWKPPDVLQWMQDAAMAAIELAEKGDVRVEQYASQRKSHYEGAPLNIVRHIICSEIQPAIAALPPQLASSINMYDPVPPPNIRSIYDDLLEAEPEGPEFQGTALEAFLRSLVPNYNGAAAAANGDGFEIGAVPQRLMEAVENLGLGNLFARAPAAAAGGGAEQEGPGATVADAVAAAGAADDDGALLADLAAALMEADAEAEARANDGDE